MDPRLFDAAFTGSVNALLELIQQDRLILHTVTVATSNTPLHIAALLGHAEFAMVVMHYCSEFAREVNQQGHTPIHLASAKGHCEIVRKMLFLQPDLALIKDDDGKNFLHTAVARGRSQVLMEFFSPELAKELTLNDETVLHLAVRHNQYQTLVTLIQLVNQQQIGIELLKAKDQDGNTIFHLACAGKKSKIVKLLVSDPTSVEMINAVNSEGLTALDIAVRTSNVGGFNNEDEIQEVLRSAGGVMSGHTEQPVVTNPLQQGLARAESQRSSKEGSMDSLRNGVGVVALLFATQSFEFGMNPPGGAWQDWAPGAYQNTTQHMPGISIGWELQRSKFFGFLSWNAASFFNSLLILVFLAYSRCFQIERWYLLVYYLFGSLLVCASVEFVEGMALITHTNSTYVSSKICLRAWGQLAAFVAFALFVLPFCRSRMCLPFCRKSQHVDEATGGGEERI